MQQSSIVLLNINKWLNGIYLDNQSFVESCDQINHIYFMYNMECVHKSNNTMKYKNSSKFLRYQTSENILCLNDNNIPSPDQQIISLFQSVVLFLNENKLVILFFFSVMKKQETSGNW